MSDYEEKAIKLMVQEGGRLLSEVERLQAENDRLRAQIRQTVESASDLIAENVKLCELVRDISEWMWVATYEGQSFDDRFASRMAELGIEGAE